MHMNNIIMAILKCMHGKAGRTLKKLTNDYLLVVRVWVEFP